MSLSISIKSLAFMSLALSLSYPCLAQEPEPEKLELRVLDVRDIVHIEPRFLPATVLEASFSPNSPDTAEEGIVAIQLGDLITLIMAGTGHDYWGQEGVEIRPEDSGLLSVSCSKEQHAKIGKVLGQLRHMLFEPVMVEVHELPDSALDARRTVLSAKEADERIQAAGLHPVHVGRTTLHKRLLVESNQIQNRIGGINIKVASEAATLDPVVVTDAYGASWQVMASRTVGDSLLVTVSGSTRALSPRIVTREVRTGEGTRAAEVELTTTSITTCLSSARLKPGEAMLIGSRADDGNVLCVRIRRLGPAAQTILGDIEAFPIGSLVQGAPKAPNPHVTHENSPLFPEQGEDQIPAVCDPDRLMEMITSQVRVDTWDGAPNTMHVQSGHLLVHADAATIASVRQHLQMLDAIDARQFTLELRFGEVASADAGFATASSIAQLAEALPQTCLSTLSASRGTQLSATRHSQAVSDYRSELASGIAATEPHIATITEGFLLRGSVAAMHEQSVLLDVNMTILKRDPKRAMIDLKHPAIGLIDSVRVREHKVRGSSPVELGKWTLLHLTPLQGGQMHFAVAAQVREL